MRVYKPVLFNTIYRFPTIPAPRSLLYSQRSPFNWIIPTREKFLLCWNFPSLNQPSSTSPTPTHIGAFSVHWGHQGQTSFCFPRIYWSQSCPSQPWLFLLQDEHAQINAPSSYKIFSRLRITLSLHTKIRICLYFLQSPYRINCSLSDLKSPAVRTWSFVSNLNITNRNVQSFSLGLSSKRTLTRQLSAWEYFTFLKIILRFLSFASLV